MKKITTQEFLGVIEQITNSAPGAISLDSDLKKLPRWDSMAILDFIATADERCGVEIAAADLRGCKTVQDLAQLFGDGIVA